MISIKKNKTNKYHYLSIRNSEEILRVDNFLYNNYSKILYKDIQYDVNNLTENELIGKCNKEL